MTNASECVDAASRIGKIFKSIFSQSSVPSGCVLYQPSNFYGTGLNVYYNFNTNNISSNTWNRLCERAEGINNNFMKI